MYLLSVFYYYLFLLLLLLRCFFLPVFLNKFNKFLNNNLVLTANAWTNDVQLVQEPSRVISLLIETV